MAESLSLTDVAALLRIPVAVARDHDYLGILPFVRIDVDGEPRYISPHAAIVAFQSDKNFAKKQADADARRVQAENQMVIDSERRAQAVNDARKQTELAAANANAFARAAREDAQRKLRDTAHANSDVRRT